MDSQQPNNSIFSRFSSNKYVTGSREFLESNSLVAKVAFLLLVLVLFIVLLQIGTRILSYLFSFNQSPYLIDGMINAKQMMIIPQDPNISGSQPIFRSHNERDGIEFTWSTWIFIDDLVYLQDQYKHIFHKGSGNILPDGLNEPNNAPGLYIKPNTNELLLIMNTFNEVDERVTITNVPMNKWVCVQIRCTNKNIDVYMNGRIAKRLQLSGVPRQNYGDVYVAQNGGFSGYISNLRYYNYALNVNEIQSIVNNGPNTKMVGKSQSKALPRYLSLRWYFAENNDSYNS
tara:strand:- start:2968 stop:3828 length:861 start_codon:yes stop_codon:yes gene_type:complete